jgi:DNA repair exonuclease SbcCD nuclease subunit
MSSFKFIHAADIHLDSPLYGLSRYEGVPLDDVRGATRAAFDNLVAFAIRNAVNFIVIAGDLFDGDWKDMGTGLYFTAAMTRLSKAGILVFVASGNHDADSVITKALPAIEQIKFFSSRKAETFRIAELGVAIHGRSFANAHMPDDMTPDYPAADRGAFNIGVLHTSLGGYANHAVYAPCALTTLLRKEYAYWALGHVHDHAVLNERPYVVFSGNLQGRHIRETGSKGAVLVEVEDGNVSNLTHVPLDIIRWHRIDLACDGITDEDSLHNRIKQCLREQCLDGGGGLPAIARVTLSGRNALSDRWRDREQFLRDEARALAAQISPSIWIEKFKVRTEPLEMSRPLSGVGMDIEGLLAQAIADGDLAEILQTEFRPFLSSLREPLGKEEDDMLSLARADKWGAVAGRAAAALRARLTEASS